MKLRFSHLAVICALMVLATGVGTPIVEAQAIVDDFAGGTGTLSVANPMGLAVDTAFEIATVPPSLILGGERDLILSLGAGTGSATAGVSSGLAFTDSGVEATLEVQWDGADMSATLVPTGLGGIDLTAGGANTSFDFDYIATDNGPAMMFAIPLMIEIYSTPMDFATGFASLIDTSGMTVSHSIPFSNFTITNMGDFSMVGAVRLLLGSPGTSDYMVTLGGVTYPVELQSLAID